MHTDVRRREIWEWSDHTQRPSSRRRTLEAPLGGLGGTLQCSERAVGCRGYTRARVGRDKAPLFACAGRRHWEERLRVVARAVKAHAYGALAPCWEAKTFSRV